MSDWQNRIVENGVIDPREVEANLHNWRRHPDAQRRALEGIMREVGWVQSVIVNRRTGRLIDGHLRVAAALDSGEKLIPVTFVELTEEEELKALAALDSITDLAVADDAALADLLSLVAAEDDDLADFFKSLNPDVEPFDDLDSEEIFDPEPISEPEPLVRQLTFNVTLDQRDKIVEAIDSCRADTLFTPAEALVIICREYLDAR